MVEPITITLITVCLALQLFQSVSDVILHIKSYNSGCLGKPLFSVKASFIDNNKQLNNGKVNEAINSVEMIKKIGIMDDKSLIL